MKRQVKQLICMLLALVLLAGCAAGGNATSSAATLSVSPSASQEEASSSAAGDSITVVDHLDRTVTVPKNVQRIAVCDIYPLPSVLSVFFDSAEKIVGMPEQSMTAAKNSLLGELYPEILSADTGYTTGGKVNMEELLKLEPDVVFYSASSAELGDQLTQAGFAAVAVSVNKWGYNSIETLNQWISLLSKIFPDNDKTEIVQKHSDEMYQLVRGRVEKLSQEERANVFFLFQYSESSIKTSGSNFFGQWWADAIGANNAATEIDTDNAIEVNLEQIYKWNPNLIFITNFTSAEPQDLYENTVGNYDWSGVKAVSEKRVYKMPLGMYRSYTPGVDTPVTLLWLAKTAYPGLFTDIDLTTEAKDYYKEVFGISLTDEQVEKIFAPAAAAGSGFNG